MNEGETPKKNFIARYFEGEYTTASEDAIVLLGGGLVLIGMVVLIWYMGP